MLLEEVVKNCCPDWYSKPFLGADRVDGCECRGLGPEAHCQDQEDDQERSGRQLCTLVTTGLVAKCPFAVEWLDMSPNGSWSV